jgi:rhomboid protease GluP
LWWHNTPIASAGASGAIFGMYGVFLALLISNLIPKQIRDSLLKSIAIFIGYNLLYGMKSGVDNSAHIGGLLSGLVIGYGYLLTMRKEQEGKKKQTILLIVSIATVAVAYLYLQNNKVGTEERNAAVTAVNESKHNVGQKFLEGLNSFSEMEDKALSPFKDSTQLMDASLIKRLDETSLPEWNKAEELLQEMRSYNISESSKKKVDLLIQYVQLRKDQIEVFRKFIPEKTEENNRQLNEVSNKIEKVIDELKKL